MNTAGRRWTEHIWLLGVDEFPSFFVRGKSASALVEGGLSALASTILSDAEAISGAAPFQYLMAAHAHADHVCGLVHLKQLNPGLALCGSTDTDRILGKTKVLKNFFDEDFTYTHYLASGGFSVKPQNNCPPTPVSLDITLRDHRVMDLGDVSIEIVDIPGHAPGGLSFLVRPDNAILISDAAGYANTSDDILPLFFHSFKDAVSSLEKLNGLHPEHLALGHNVLVDGKPAADAFFKAAINAAVSMRKDIKEKLENHISVDRVASEMSDKMKRYGLFNSFSHRKRMQLAQLLIKRAIES